MRPISKRYLRPNPKYWAKQHPNCWVDSCVSRHDKSQLNNYDSGKRYHVRSIKQTKAEHKEFNRSRASSYRWCYGPGVVDQKLFSCAKKVAIAGYDVFVIERTGRPFDSKQLTTTKSRMSQSLNMEEKSHSERIHHRHHFTQLDNLSGTRLIWTTKQPIISIECYVIPLSVISGLHYLSLHPFTDGEQDKLPHPILKADDD